MTINKSQPKRGKEILELIQNHGPVSIDMLQRMMQPQMPKKNLRKSLAVLRKKNLIDLVTVTPQTVYYQMSQARISREKSAEILNCHADDVTQPLLRKQDWLHNQWCEYWILVINRLFPEAEIIREQTVGSSNAAKRILQLNERDYDLMPDFLVLFPKNDSGEATHIAFEIERTRKSNKRLIRKFKKYMTGTRIDGLIYLCDSGRLSETLRILYQFRLADNAPRIKHYGNHFFLFSDSMDGGGPEMNRMFNANGEHVSFVNWCIHLRNTKRNFRRDSQFK